MKLLLLQINVQNNNKSLKRLKVQTFVLKF